MLPFEDASVTVDLPSMHRASGCRLVHCDAAQRFASHLPPIVQMASIPLTVTLLANLTATARPHAQKTNMTQQSVPKRRDNRLGFL